MRDDELWASERSFWLDSVAFCEQGLAPDALLVLPRGIFDRSTGFSVVGATLPWVNLVLSNQHCVHPTADMAVLAYEARADRGDESTAYRAYCSSTYVHSCSSWLLLAHHQTHIGDFEQRLGELEALRFFFALPRGNLHKQSHVASETHAIAR